MIDKALMIIIFFYAAGLMFIGMEASLGSLYGIQIVSPVDGTPVTTNISTMLVEAEFNTRTQSITTANYTGNSTFYDRVETFTTGAAFVAWELIQLMTGTLIFNIMLLFGVPAWLVTLFVTGYILLLARAIIGYVRGI